MNRKLTLILALLVLAVISVSIVTAVNETSDSIAADENSNDSISQDINADDGNDKIAIDDDGNDKIAVDDDKQGNGGLTVKKVWNDNDKIAVDDDGNDKIAVDDDKQGNGGLTVKKVWNDNDNAAGKRPSSIKFTILENNEVRETGCEITESMGWKATLDFAVSADSTYEIVEEDVPEGYTASVTGNVEDGFVITNTLKEDHKNDTDHNKTHPNDNPKNDTPKNNNHVKENKTIEKETVTVPAKNESAKARDTHKTGNPILLGILAVSAAGLAIQLRRKE